MRRRRPAVALIDGEHYPPVVVDALAYLSDRFDFRAVFFLGGAEKIRQGNLEEVAESMYGLPVFFDDDWARGIERAIDIMRPEVVVDLSDEPVLGYEQRFRLIGHALGRNVDYVGSDFHFSPVSSGRHCAVPSLSIVGTAKRVGKTAISGFVARECRQCIQARPGSPGVVVVAMGRGGPAQPEIIDGSQVGLTVEDLLRWSREGRHAASDHFEDAVISRVVTVGCRRCGGGMAGEPFYSNVVEGARLANELKPGLVVFEGSGASMPPVATDARLLVAGANQPVEYVAGYLGAYRVLTSDAVALAMAEEPLASPEKVRAHVVAIKEVKPGIEVLPLVFRPRPLGNIQGRNVAVFSTVPRGQQGLIGRHLEERWGCRVRLFSSNLADRIALKHDLMTPQMDAVDMILTEIKAAAIDVVAEAAADRGLEVGFLDNEPTEVGGTHKGRLAELARELSALAKERFETQTRGL